MSTRSLRLQRGVAVVTALLLTTLAITIVASLFWQQQVQVRSIENQRLQLQKQWILRGALDWTRLILREDKRINQQQGRLVDHLGEPWAVPLAETRLDQYVENGSARGDVPDAALSGGIVDAQARFNLNNMCCDLAGAPKPAEVAVFGRILTNARQNPALAQAAAQLMASAQRKPAEGGSNSSANNSSTPQPMSIVHVDDLLAVPGFTPEILARIRDFIIVLTDEEGKPISTSINVNTAPAEVLAARIDTLSLSDAAAIIVSRERTPFYSTTNFREFLQAQGKPVAITEGLISVNTNYFLINGNVRLNRAGMQMQALIDRRAGNPKVLWIRED